MEELSIKTITTIERVSGCSLTLYGVCTAACKYLKYTVNLAAKSNQIRSYLIFISKVNFLWLDEQKPAWMIREPNGQSLNEKNSSLYHLYWNMTRKKVHEFVFVF